MLMCVGVALPWMSLDILFLMNFSYVAVRSRRYYVYVEKRAYDRSLLLKQRDKIN